MQNSTCPNKQNHAKPFQNKTPVLNPRKKRIALIIRIKRARRTMRKARSRLDMPKSRPSMEMAITRMTSSSDVKTKVMSM